MRTEHQRALRYAGEKLEAAIECLLPYHQTKTPDEQLHYAMYEAHHGLKGVDALDSDEAGAALARIKESPAWPEVEGQGIDDMTDAERRQLVEDLFTVYCHCELHAWGE